MTDLARAYASAVVGENQIETLLDGVLDRLHWMNARMLALHDEIKAAQPVASGSICLELYPCGSGCSGCPHPRWVRYVWVPTPRGDNRLVASNLDAQERDPVLLLKRKEEGYTELAALIREAKAVIAERSELMERLRSLRPFHQRQQKQAESDA